MMKREFETLDEQHLRGKPTHMAQNDNVIAIANDIARKYIPVDCELSKVMTGLVNAGFKVSDISQLNLPALKVSIFLRKWFDIFPVEFRLKIEHQAGRIKLVTVSIHHYFF